MAKELFLGNKYDNIAASMKRSVMARVVFVLCCWSVYERIEMEAGGIAGIITSVVLGAVVMNCLYIPFRMLGNKKVSDRWKMVFVLAAVVIATWNLNYAGVESFTDIFNIILKIIIVAGIVSIAAAIIWKMPAVHPQKGKWLYRKQNFDQMDGWEFEEWCGMWLQENGFDNIKVTSGSGDYGADVLCSKNGVTYAVQCKKYSGKVPYRAVEEVICAQNYYRTDRAMIFTNSELTTQAGEAAHKLGVIVYDGTVICR